MKLWKSCGLALAIVAGFCCAAAQAQSEPSSDVASSQVGSNPKDPFEKYNRTMFEFNDAVDNAIFKPVAKGYKAVVPEPARNCIGNVFSNVGDVFVAVNNLLQGKPGEAASDVCRVVVNSTIGLLGCFDVASEMGLTKHNEDFGQTLGRWGFNSGPYMVLPFFGPSSLRDSFGLVLDVHFDPVANIQHVPTRNTLVAVRFVDRRAQLLAVGDLLEKVALDRYAYVRDAYLQRRRSQVYDGNPPEDSAPAKTAEVAPAEPVVAMQRPTEVPVGWFDAPTQREPAPAKL